MSVDPLADKYRAFGWNVITVDGHDIAAIQEAFRAARGTRGKPSVIIADTVKGKGVSFMENQAGWHGVATKGFEQLEKALLEIGSPACTPAHARELLARAEEFQKDIDERIAAGKAAVLPGLLVERRRGHEGRDGAHPVWVRRLPGEARRRPAPGHRARGHLLLHLHRGFREDAPRAAGPGA